MEKVICRRKILLETRKSNKIAFGLVDDKRRYVGMRVTVHNIEMTAAENGQGGYRFVPGSYFMVECHITRDGIDYGASNAYSYFETMEEAEAHAVARIESAYKRYARNYGEVFPRDTWAKWS